MAEVAITSVDVKNNPAAFGDDIELEVQYECLSALKDDLEWKVIYVGSAEDEEYDQVGGMRLEAAPYSSALSGAARAASGACAPLLSACLCGSTTQLSHLLFPRVGPRMPLPHTPRPSQVLDTAFVGLVQPGAYTFAMKAPCSMPMPPPTTFNSQPPTAQVLDTAFVGPVQPGAYKFAMKAPAPDAGRIPQGDVVGVTALLLTCSYQVSALNRLNR